MSRLLLIDGNSIVNRAFYGIMGNKMLSTADGTYTNAIYGFLTILFKNLDDLNPDYLAIAFDLKSPTFRHKMYDGYKSNRKGMPDELASQMPILKNLLREMNIAIIEKESYEADDILGTLSRMGEEKNIDVTILSGDRDTFQLITPKITVRIPRTKVGKTETEDFNIEKINEVYGIKPIKLIEVKGLMGDSSDCIPGIPGVGEKTALNLVKEYDTIENLYEKVEKGEDSLKGALKKKVVENKDLAILSKTLGTINKNVPLDVKIKDLEKKEWNKQEVLSTFRELRFNRFIERFNLDEENTKTIEDLFEIEQIGDNFLKGFISNIEKQKEFYYYFETIEDLNQKVVNKKINKISIFSNNKVYEIKINNEIPKELKQIFENKFITKIGYGLKEDYILLKQANIKPDNMSIDIKIAAYLLNSNSNQYSLQEIAGSYLKIDYNAYLNNNLSNKEKQISLFERTR